MDQTKPGHGIWTRGNGERTVDYRLWIALERDTRHFEATSTTNQAERPRRLKGTGEGWGR